MNITTDTEKKPANMADEWVMVPKVPTEAMCKAGEFVDGDPGTTFCSTPKIAGLTWKAMLAAAPQPPAKSSPGTIGKQGWGDPIPYPKMGDEPIAHCGEKTNDWRARLGALETRLRENGVVDVKFDFVKTDISLSETANHVADVLEAILDKHTKKFVGLGDSPTQLSNTPEVNISGLNNSSEVLTKLIKDADYLELDEIDIQSIQTGIEAIEFWKQHKDNDHD